MILEVPRLFGIDVIPSSEIEQPSIHVILPNFFASINVCNNLEVVYLIIWGKIIIVQEDAYNGSSHDGDEN